MTPPSGDPHLATLLRLLGPADGDPGPGPLAALPWAPMGAGATTLLRQTTRRTGASATARARALAARRGLTVVRPTRGSLSPGVRDRLRRSAGSGYVAQLRTAGATTLLDRVLADARAELAGDLGVGADGAVRALVVREGRRGLLRMGLTGSPADPAAAIGGLRVLAEHAVARVPVLLADGDRAGVRWSLESALPGRRPRAVTPALAGQVAAFVAALPRTDAAVDLTADAATVVAAAPSDARGVQALVERLRTAPPAGQGVLRHGDLWSGNLLADGDALTGVVDWDAWSPAGVPAVDLLHLLGTEERLRTRASLGEVWLRAPWDAPGFVALVRRHWPDWGDDPAARAAVGAAWWLGQVAADLRRNAALAHDPRWVGRNIQAVTATAPDPVGSGAGRPPAVGRGPCLRRMVGLVTLRAGQLGSKNSFCRRRPRCRDVLEQPGRFPAQAVPDDAAGPLQLEGRHVGPSLGGPDHQAVLDDDVRRPVGQLHVGRSAVVDHGHVADGDVADGVVPRVGSTDLERPAVGAVREHAAFEHTAAGAAVQVDEVVLVGVVRRVRVVHVQPAEQEVLGPPVHQQRGEGLRPTARRRRSASRCRR